MASLSSPLLKIPLIIVCAAGGNIAFSSPNPPARPEEKQRYGKEDIVTKLSLKGPIFSKVAIWSLAICEIAVIIARQYPSTYSNTFLSILTHRSISSASNVTITPAFMAGWISLVVGVLIRIACYRSLGRHFTFQLSVIDDHKLITGGPYSIVRHPGYTGFVLFTIGLLTCEYGSGSWIAECGLMSTWIGIVAFSWAVYFVYVTVLLVARVPTEDSILQKEFGVQWNEWAKRTPYRLVPGIV